jgi:hypothetical protein
MLQYGAAGGMKRQAVERSIMGRIAVQIIDLHGLAGALRQADACSPELTGFTLERSPDDREVRFTGAAPDRKRPHRARRAGQRE